MIKSVLIRLIQPLITGKPKIVEANIPIIEGCHLYLDTSTKPSHKKDLMIVVYDPVMDEKYITGGWYDGDTNTFEKYGFEDDSYKVIFWRYLTDKEKELTITKSFPKESQY